MGKRGEKYVFILSYKEVSTYLNIFACSEIQVVINISLISKAHSSNYYHKHNG